MRLLISIAAGLLLIGGIHLLGAYHVIPRAAIFAFWIGFVVGVFWLDDFRRDHNRTEEL